MKVITTETKDWQQLWKDKQLSVGKPEPTGPRLPSTSALELVEPAASTDGHVQATPTDPKLWHLSMYEERLGTDFSQKPDSHRH